MSTTPDDTTSTDTEQTAPGAEHPETEQNQPEAEDSETFPRSYVEQLRRESASYRERAQQADQYAARLHTALTAATGRLADPTDLTFDPAHLDDDQALTTAIDELLASKPHLASRRVTGDVGQGAGTPDTVDIDLAGMLRARV